MSETLSLLLFGMFIGGMLVYIAMLSWAGSEVDKAVKSITKSYKDEIETLNEEIKLKTAFISEVENLVLFKNKMNGFVENKWNPPAGFDKGKLNIPLVKRDMESIS